MACQTADSPPRPYPRGSPVIDPIRPIETVLGESFATARAGPRRGLGQSIDNDWLPEKNS